MKVIIAFALVAAVSCNDLVQGPPVGKKIYNETKEASPAIWKQKEEITIKSKDNERISRVCVQDLRPEKDGEAKIVEGGVGQKNVTVELKSPTILRGFAFHIEVFVVEDFEHQGIHAHREMGDANPIEGTKTNENATEDKLKEQMTTEATDMSTLVSFERKHRQINTSDKHADVTDDTASTTKIVSEYGAAQATVKAATQTVGNAVTDAQSTENADSSTTENGTTATQAGDNADTTANPANGSQWIYNAAATVNHALNNLGIAAQTTKNSAKTAKSETGVSTTEAVIMTGKLY